MTDHAHHDHHHVPREPAEPPDHTSWVAAQREAKDDYFKHAARSPIPAEDRAAFTGLPYFPVEPALRFELLRLRPLPEGLAVETHVQTSDGRVRLGQRVGSLEFAVGGRPQRLVALQLEGSSDGSLFVPFRDATSGVETYEAGRYLDLAAEEDGTYDLDFNLAYAPFCAYSPAYSCPLPPAENWLTVPIRAGERNA